MINKISHTWYARNTNYNIRSMWSDVWNVSYNELRILNQVSYDHRSYERNLSKELSKFFLTTVTGVWRKKQNFLGDPRSC